VLLESGFKQLEKFYLETGAPGAPSALHCGSGAAIDVATTADGGGEWASYDAGKQQRSAVEETMAHLREETSAARERLRTLMEALHALGEGVGPMTSLDALSDEETFFANHAQEIEVRLRQARVLRDELGRTERQRDELSQQVSHLEREAVVAADEMEKANDDLAGVQAERDLLERKVNELRRELHAKNKEIEAVDAELQLAKSQQVRTLAKLSVQKCRAEKQLVMVRAQLKKLDDDKNSLFREVSSLEAQLAQAQADREESRNWASTYRDMLLKVT
jgi:chromosome segregation ATPase